MAAALCLRAAAAFILSDDLVSVAPTEAGIWLFLVAAARYGAFGGNDRFALVGSGLVVAAVGRLVLSAF